MSWTNLSNKTLVARRAHRCIWCGQDIDKGRAYHRSQGICDGDFQSNGYHPECWNAALDYFRSGEKYFSPMSFKRGSTQEKQYEQKSK